MTTFTPPPFSTLPSLLARFDKVGRRHAYNAKTLSAHKKWRRETLAKLQEITGYDTFEPCPLKPKITEEIEFDGYRRQRVEIQTERGVIMPVYVLIPTNPEFTKSTGKGKVRLPAVINPHGHGSGGKLSPAGCRDHSPEIAAAIDKYDYAYGVQYARAGFISFCPDARGFGERQEFYQKQQNIIAHSCQHINQMAYPLGRTVTGMWAWDLHRLVDYICTRTDCDSNRIGCAGLSGGGLQTLWLSAFDERIKCAVVSGYFYGYKQSLLELYTNCSCNYVPHLYENVDMGDIAALIAPRPLLIETGTKDDLNGRDNLKNVASQLKITRQAYKTFNAANHVAQDVFEGPHKWHGGKAITWMKQWI